MVKTSNRSRTNTFLTLPEWLREWVDSPALLLWIVFGLGVFVRIVHVVIADFPLNDGGLFYVMIQELRGNHYALPFYTSFNAQQIPFAYPPLSFYLAGLLAEAFQLPLIEVIRFLPPILSSLTIPAFYLLAKQIFEDEAMIFFGTMAFAFLPRSFIWLIMGGGLTRATGLVCAMLALGLLIAFFKNRNWAQLFFSALFAGLTLLSHPEAALFTAIGAIVIVINYRRNWFELKYLFFMGVIAVSLAAPWLIITIYRHGVSPLSSAFSSTATSSVNRLLLPLLTILRFNFAEEAGLTMLSVFGLLGLFRCLKDRQFFIPMWLFAVLLIYTRGTPTYATIPLALLAAYGFVKVVLRGLSAETGPQFDNKFWIHELFQNSALKLFFGFVLILTLSSAFIYPFVDRVNSPLVSLAQGEVEAMRWISSETRVDGKFIILSGRSWWSDPTSEWFPVLAGRESLSTVQGYEWLPGQRFHRQWFMNEELQSCIQKGVECVQEWAAEYSFNIEYVFLPKTSSTQLILNNFFANSRFELAFENTDAVIFYNAELK